MFFRILQPARLCRFYKGGTPTKRIFDLFQKVKSTRGRHLVIEPPPNYDKIYTFSALIILCLDLEVSLRVVANHIF